VLLAYAESKKEYVLVKKVLNYILGIIDICFITFALSNIFMDFRSFANLDNLRSFLLPPILMLAFLPFIYLFVNVHSQIRAQTKREAERVGKYMSRPLLSLKRLFFFSC